MEGHGCIHIRSLPQSHLISLIGASPFDGVVRCAHLDNRPFWPGSTTRDGTTHGVAQFAHVVGVLHRPRHHTTMAPGTAYRRNLRQNKEPTPPKITRLSKNDGRTRPSLFMTCTLLEFSRCLSRSTRNRKKGKLPIVTNARPLDKTERRHHPPSTESLNQLRA